MKICLVGSVIFSRRMLAVLLRETRSLASQSPLPPGEGTGEGENRKCGTGGRFRAPYGGLPASDSLTPLHISAVFGIPHEHSTNISDYADLAGPCRRAGVPYFPFRKINSPEVLARFAEVRPDVTFVFGLSQLLSSELLKLTGLTIGTHPALLPDGRGRAAVAWSILLGWKKSGISFFGITEGVDEGLIYEQEAWDIGPRDDSTKLYGKMLKAGDAALTRLLHKLAAGTLAGRPQGTPTIGPLGKRTPEDGRIDWTRSAEEIDRLIRASARPYPGAFTFLPDGTKLVIWKSAGPTAVPAKSAAPGTVLASSPGSVTVATGTAPIVCMAFEPRGSIPAGARLGQK